MNLKKTPLLKTTFLAFGLVVCIVGCQQNQPETPSYTGSIEGAPGSNVILITLDTARTDHFGCYGGDPDVTPIIDSRMAQKGIRFSAAYATAPITLPSHASMLTGLYPYNHGVRANGSFALGEEFQTLASVFKETGYSTGAFISAAVLTKRYGLARDFDVYDDDLSQSNQPQNRLVPARPGNFTIDAALQWIRSRDRERPFFCWIHLYDPHAPHNPPPEFAARFPEDPYTAEIAFSDSLVGRVLDEIKAEQIQKETYVTVISDHGEALGEHNERSHGILLHQATTSIPWLLVGPGIPEGAVISNPTTCADIAPTLAALAGVPAPNGAVEDSTNVLAPDRLTPEWGNERTIIVESLLSRFQYGWAPLYGIIRNQWELIQGGRNELFDLKNDPKELKDRSSEEREILDDLTARLEPVVNQGTTEETRLEITPGERDRLASLGYLEFESAQRDQAPDPRDVIGAHTSLEHGLALISAGSAQEGLETLQQGLDLDPTNVSIMTQKAQAHLQLNEIEDARRELARSLALDPKKVETIKTLANLELQQRNFQAALILAEQGATARGAFETFSPIKAQALIGLGQIQEAIDFIDHRLTIQPSNPELLLEKANEMLRFQKNAEETERLMRRAITEDVLFGQAYLQLAHLLQVQRRFPEAISVLEEFLRIQPGNARALLAIGTMKMENDPASAVPYLEESVRLAPTNPLALTTLGIAYIQANRVPDAEVALRKATGLDPGQPQIRNNLAIVLIQQNKFQEAIDELNMILDAHPGFHQGRNNLAIALRGSGDLDAAENEARKAVEQEPRFLDSRLTLASIYQQQQRWAEEYETLNQLFRMAPDRPDIRNNLALAASKTNHCPQALQLLEPSLKRGESLTWEIHLAAARCLEASGTSTDALRHFEEAARRSPDGPGRDEAQKGVQRLSLQLKVD